MDRRHFHRRNQRSHHCRKSAREAGRAPEGILGNGVVGVPHAVEWVRTGRSRPLGVQRDECGPGRHIRCAGVLPAARSARTVVAARLSAIAELLRHRAVARDAGTFGGFRSDQQLQDAVERRCRRRHDRQLSLFRQCRVQQAEQKNRCRPHHGLRRATAGISFHRDRGRALLGRRHLIEYAIGLCAGHGNRTRSFDFPDRPVQRAGRAAAIAHGRSRA